MYDYYVKSVIKRIYQNKLLINWRIYALCIAYMISVLSLPIPDKFGLVEIIIAFILIVVSLSLAGEAYKVITHNRDLMLIMICVLCLLVVPTIAAIIYNNSINDYIRDIVPFCFFMILPIVFFFAVYDLPGNKFSKYIVPTLGFVAFVSVIQFYTEMFSLFDGVSEFTSEQINYFDVDSGEYSKTISDLNYNTQITFLRVYEPSVLFIGIYLVLSSVYLFFIKHKLLSVMVMFGGLFILSPALIVGLRAYLLLFLFGLLVFSIYMVYISKKYNYLLIILLLLACVIVSLNSVGVFELMYHKTAVMGSNGKLQELYSVIDVLTKNIIYALFGLGWGGKFENPVFMDEETRFTHSLVTFILLKTGMSGMVIFSVYVYKMYKDVLVDIFGDFTPVNLILLMSVFSVIVVAVMFQPIYKMLGFGYVLSILVLLKNNIDGNEPVLDSRESQ